MAKSESKTVAISDSGPIIHLDELASLGLLSDFNPLIIPKIVHAEVSIHRPKALQRLKVVFTVIDVISPPEPQLLALSRALSLDKGKWSL